jgi:hypothetical protein
MALIKTRDGGTLDTGKMTDAEVEEATRALIGEIRDNPLLEILDDELHDEEKEELVARWEDEGRMGDRQKGNR